MRFDPRRQCEQVNWIGWQPLTLGASECLCTPRLRDGACMLLGLDGSVSYGQLGSRGREPVPPDEDPKNNCGQADCGKCGGEENSKDERRNGDDEQNAEAEGDEAIRPLQGGNPLP